LTKDTLAMLKKVMLYDGIILLISFIISIIFFTELTAIIIIGIVIALFNFFLNSVLTEYAIKTSRGAAWIPFGALIRIAIAGAFVLLLYNGELKNVIAFIVGYSLHYASMVIGAVMQKSR